MTTAVTDEFRELMQEFIRRFGLLGADRTPCGKPLASSDAHALMLLVVAGADGMLPSALATQLGVDKSTATRVVARLTAAGHIASAPGTDDARAKPIRLTKKGARVAAEVQAASRDRFTRLLEHVPARRRAEVLGSLRELVSALAKMTSSSEDKEG